MEIVRFAIRNPVKVAVGVILLLMFGVLSIFQIRVQLTPDVDRPVITVRTSWIGASPQEVESEIVDRQEEKLKNVSGLTKLVSSSRQNAAEIRLEFPVGVDKDRAFRDVSDRLRQVTGYPDEVDEPVITATDNDMAKTIAWMILYSKEGTNVADLKSFLEDHVKPILERAEGISEVSVYGGHEREIQIEIDPYRLAARGLTFRDVESALRRQNKNISAGTVNQGKRDYSYRTIGEFRNLASIEETVIAYKGGGPVLIGDIATVIDGFKKPTGFVRSKGRDVIAMPARRETGANVLEAMANLKKQVEVVNREILSVRGLGLELTQVYDETHYILSAIGLVIRNIFFGGFLAIVVLFVFLRSISGVGIIAVTIPISVIGTIFVIGLLGRSINVVLLAGMAFAVGMVVDNAIVVLENIYRHRSMGKDKMQAALDGTREVWGAILASTLTTMAVFLPIITIQDEAGQLFKDIAIAISSAVALSLFVSVLVIPPLAARFFHAGAALAAGEPSGNPNPADSEASVPRDAFNSRRDRPWPPAAWVSSVVERIHRTVSARVVVVAGFSGASVLATWLFMPAAEYLPAGNKNLIFGLLFTPPGYSVETFREMAMIVEDGDPNDPYDGLRPAWTAEIGSELAGLLPEIEISLGKDGASKRKIVPPPIENFFFVSFDGGAFMGCTSKIPTNVKPLEQVMARAGQRIPGVFTMFNQASLFSGGGRGTGNTVDFEIRGDDLDQVYEAASAIRRKTMELGYSYPSATPANFDLGRPEVRMVPDRARAADLGLDVRDVGFILRACVDGAFVGEYNDHGDKVDMTLTVANTKFAALRDIESIPVFTPTGNIVPISSAVTFSRSTAAQEIVHIEEMGSVTLSIKPKMGVPLQQTMWELEEQVISPLRRTGAIPAGVMTSLAGTADKLTQTRRALVGDFRNTIDRVAIPGLSAGVTALLVLLTIAVAIVTVRSTLGTRQAVVTALVLVVGGAVVFLMLNPKLMLMLFQSRAVLALLVTYLLMAALFESFIYPLVIMFSIPLAAVGGVLSLRIVHEVSLYDVTSPIQQLDVLTMLGFVILVGIVVNNAILIIHQALNYMKHENLEPSHAVIRSVQTRTRPILMSALTSLFGMLPLVVMSGAGSELYRGLGSVVLGGLLVSTVFTLIVIPAIFTLVLDLQAFLRREAPGVESISDTAPVGAHTPSTRRRPNF